MITTIVKFTLSNPITNEEAKSIFKRTAPKYQNIPGLIRKSYIIFEEGVTIGGIYLWNSPQDAEALYTDSWKDFVLDKYGTLPEILYVETPVIVDNVTQEIVYDNG